MTTDNPANATQVAESKVVADPGSTVTPSAADPAKATQDPAAVVQDPAAAKPPEKVVPEKYELKTDEAKFLKPADIERIEKTAREKGLSNDEAQELLTHENGIKQQFSDDQTADYHAKVESWKAEVSRDPEFGGEKFGESAEHAKRAIQKHGTPELQKIMDSTGFGNHPEVFKFFARLGKSMADDSLVVPGAQGHKRSTTRILYPTMEHK